MLMDKATVATMAGLSSSRATSPESAPTICIPWKINVENA
jgi:hypothetical protein